MANYGHFGAPVLGLFILSACGGGSGSGTPDVTPVYETLRSAAPVESTLGGVALRTNGTTGELEIVSVSGTTTHDTGYTQISDGTYILTDADGFNGGTTLTDGVSTITVDSSLGDAASYDYVIAYEQSYTSGDTAYDLIGIGGVITDAADMPTDGSVVYNGQGAIVLATKSSGYDIESASSSITANFISGAVTATMTGFTATDLETGEAATAPIDTLVIADITMSGNGFSGGTLSTTLAGGNVDLTGANTTAATHGAFFGFSGDYPQEAGGLFLFQGDDGILAGGFLGSTLP